MKLLSMQWQNILSWGDDFTSIDFSNIESSILIKGGQGDGKSSIIEIIFFSIFGKLIRTSDTSSTIINRYTKANMQTNIKIMGKQDKVYEIIRYKKTKSAAVITELFIDGVELDIADKQLLELLIERDIIGMTRNEFAERVLVDIDKDIKNTTDFRTCFSNLLDLGYIDDIAREYILEKKTLDRSIIACENNILTLNKELKLLEDFETSQQTELSDNISAFEDDNIRLNELIDSSQVTVDSIDAKVKTNIEKLVKLKKYYNTYNTGNIKKQTAIAALNNSKEYINKDECSYCKQGIHVDHKEESIQKVDDNVAKFKESLATSLETTKGIKEKINELMLKNNKFALYKSKYSIDIASNKKMIEKNNTSIEACNKKRDTAYTDKIVIVKNALEVQSNNLESKNERKEMVDVIVEDVLDSEFGFKYEVILSHIDDMNDVFDKYLSRFNISDTSVFISLDFKLKVYRLGEEWTFDSMSNGEKAIINTIFMLYKLSNQKRIGLKIFDESLDDNLTSENLNILLDIIKEMYADDLLILISHKDVSNDVFGTNFLISKSDSIFSELNES